jgi:choline dehydrogenase
MSQSKHRSLNAIEQHYDFIIVGAGSSGSVVAGELARRSDASVLLVEAGPAADNNPDTLSADGFKYCFANDNVMHDRFSEKITGLNGRSVYQGTGWTMGGSGSVNGMVYTPGDKQDFTSWPKDWQWDDICPYFLRLEQRLQPQSRRPTEFTEAAIEAACLSGFSHKDGLTDGDLKGFIGHNAMNYQGDRRQSSYAAYIHNQDLPGLHIIDEALVHKILIEDGRAVGVELEQRGGRRTVNANKEVVLAAGALETPKLLMLSGVGPATVLDEFDIPLQLAQPAIGRDLHDHPNVCMFFRGKQKTDFGYPQLYAFDRVNSLSGLADGQPDTCFAFFSAPITLKQSMYRMLPALALPASLYKKSWARKIFRKIVDLLFYLPKVETFVDQLYGIVVILGKPESRGFLTLRSGDARDQALINPAYYQHPDDLLTMIRGVKRAQQIASQEQMKAWGNLPLSTGGKTRRFTSLKSWIANATMTTFHFCGSCKMGDDDDCPVDHRLKLKGIADLRIADASVFPEIPVSAINAPSMMVGLRCADFIMQEHYQLKDVPTEREKAETIDSQNEVA